MAFVISVVFVVLVIGFLVLVQIWIVGRALTRFNGNRGDRSNGHNNGMSHEDLQRLPCFDYGVGEKGSSSVSVDCAVCLEGFVLGDRCRLLPVCNHGFHAHCVDSWLLKKPICPICRTRVNPSSCQGRKVFGEEDLSRSHLGVVGLEPRITQTVAVSSGSSPLHGSPVENRDQDPSRSSE